MSSYHSATELPAPDADQVAHSAGLVDVIGQRIREAGGIISFHDYMRACLYEPGLGYYAAGSTKLGPGGDFITAPELSSLFGACLANYAAGLFEQQLDRRVLEFGAGTGKLCVDIIRRLNELDCAFHAYLILETSADLQQRQQDYCRDQLSADDFQKLHWLSELPAGFNGLVLGNEVLDAMPVNVVVKDGGWLELGVGFDGQRFEWLKYARDSAAISRIREIDEGSVLPDHYCTEINLNYRPWCRSLARSCEQAVVLMIDYGYEQAQYYHRERNTGTLICYYQHRAHPDPFIYPGLQDITAFVDFDAFADAAIEAGFTIRGLSTQAQFLLSNGLLELVAEVGSEPSQQLEMAQQVKTLTLPGEMGEKFKVIEFASGF